jgi:hypothetical protein
MVGHREQPGGESAPGWVVSGRITPQREEYFLDYVFGQLLVGADPAGQRVAGSDEALIELG